MADFALGVHLVRRTSLLPTPVHVHLHGDLEERLFWSSAKQIEKGTESTIKRERNSWMTAAASTRQLLSLPRGLKT